MKAFIKKSPRPKTNALAQSAESTKWDITGLVRRNLNIELGTQKKFSPSRSVLIKLLTPQNMCMEARAR